MIVRSWGARPALRLSGYIWVAGMFCVLAALQADRIGLFLVPPFGATLTILILLPDAPVAQPYAVICGSVVGAAVGTAFGFFGRGVAMAVLAMIAALVVINLIHAYHPPGVALAMIPVLLKPGPWFSLSVVFPFAAVAVLSAAAMSKWNSGWPAYPKPLRNSAIGPSVAKATTRSGKGVSGEPPAFPERG
jgi:CBS-domain-containing membrane protein